MKIVVKEFYNYTEIWKCIPQRGQVF